MMPIDCPFEESVSISKRHFERQRDQVHDARISHCAVSIHRFAMALAERRSGEARSSSQSFYSYSLLPLMMITWQLKAGEAIVRRSAFKVDLTEYSESIDGLNNTCFLETFEEKRQ